MHIAQQAVAQLPHFGQSHALSRQIVAADQQLAAPDRHFEQRAQLVVVVKVADRLGDGPISGGQIVEHKAARAFGDAPPLPVRMAGGGKVRQGRVLVAQQQADGLCVLARKERGRPVQRAPGGIADVLRRAAAMRQQQDPLAGAQRLLYRAVKALGQHNIAAVERRLFGAIEPDRPVVAVPGARQADFNAVGGRCRQAVQGNVQGADRR